MKLVTQCLDTEEIFYVRSKKAILEACCSNFGLLECILCYTGVVALLRIHILELSDTCLQSRKENQLIIFNTIACIS